MSSASTSGARAVLSPSAGADGSDARDSQTCTLPDGRTMGFAEYGHPEGHPVLFFHGFPSSRLAAFGVDKMACKHNLRVLSLDRPGYGLSTFQPGRRIMDWPADVQAFAAQQKLTKFGVMGASGGGPYALACAHALPREMLTGVGVMEGAGPFDGVPREVIPARSRYLAVVAERWPGVLRVTLAALVGVLRWIAQTGYVKRRVDVWLAGEDEKYREERAAKAKAAKAGTAGTAGTTSAEGCVSSDDETVMVSSSMTTSFESVSGSTIHRVASSSKDSELLEDVSYVDDAQDPRPIPERRDDVIRATFDPFAQGLEATVQEAYLLSHDWGFKFEDIAYDPIRMWHGDKDENVPLEWIMPMVERLPHADLKVYPGRNHYDLSNDLEEMMATFVPKEGGVTETRKIEEEQY